MMKRIIIQGEAGCFADVVFDDSVRCRQALEAVRPLMNERTILGEYARADRIAGLRPDHQAADGVENV